MTKIDPRNRTPRPSGRRTSIVLGGIGLLAMLVVSACNQAAVERRSLTVTLTGTGVGTVTSVPTGIDCGATCAAEFALGSSVTLTATPTDESTFEGWNVCDGEGTCTVTMSEALSVTATFAAPAAPALACVEEFPAGPAEPTLVCTLAEGRVTVEVPWQGFAVEVASLPLDGLGYLPATGGFDPGDFTPLSSWPLIHLGVTGATSGLPITTFDPVVQVTARYDAAQFAAATPFVGEGELGLGVWSQADETWMLFGYGVYHEGFWLADPIGSDDLVLQGRPADLQPRYLMTGSPAGGEAIALVKSTPPTLPISFGRLPSDPDHMLKEFDQGCETVSIDFVGDAVECASSVGLTVRVPYQTRPGITPSQTNGPIVPRVVAIPWNKASTFEFSGVDQFQTSQQSETQLIRNLMNFLVVDDADPTIVLFDFDPPLEFEVVYTLEDADPTVNPVLFVNYWDEYVERFVALGFGFTDACFELVFDEETSQFEYLGPFPGCSWGEALAAEPVDEYDGAFFQWNDEVVPSGGVARFTFDRWGDRQVAFGR
jgi:hypothetical protein